MTGWSRDFLLWELPLVEGCALIHYSLVAAGVRTIKPESTIEAELEQVAKGLLQE